MIFFTEMRKHLAGLARAKNAFLVGGGVGFLLMLGLSIGIILLANAVKAADLPIPRKATQQKPPVPKARPSQQSDRAAGMP